MQWKEHQERVVQADHCGDWSRALVLRRPTRMLVRFDPVIRHVRHQIGGLRTELHLFDLGPAQTRSQGLGGEEKRGFP